MTHRKLLATIILAAMGLTGCGLDRPGQTRDLGEVTPAQAYAAAREVLSQHSFQVATDNPETGLLVSQPLHAEAQPKGLPLPATRKIVTLQVYPKGNATSVRLSVAVESQSAGASRNFTPSEGTYSGVPNQTPAEEGAATTAQQNQGWRRLRFDPQLETAMLKDLYEALHPSAAQTAPASGPATGGQ